MSEYAGWQQLIEANGAAASRGEHIRQFLRWLDGRLGDGALKTPVSVRPEAIGAGGPLRRALEQMLAGDMVSVGLLPQLELLFLTALFHVSRGYRVFLFSNMPAAPSLVRLLSRFVESLAPVSVAVTGHVFGHSERRLVSSVEGDIVLSDYMQVFEAFHRGKDFPGERPAVALFVEADLCLYDARLTFFEREALQASAAIYRVTGKSASWQEQKHILDFARLAGAFAEIGGTASYMHPRIARELNRAYGAYLPGRIRAFPGRRISALTFKTWQEKQELLYRDLLTAEGDCLVFYVLEPLRQAMQEELRKRGRESVIIPNPRDLRTFTAMRSSKKRIGFYRGIPTLLTAPPETKAPIQPFLAEHYLLEHQHQKIRAFIDRELAPPRRPFLYFSLEDEMFNVYADEDSFSGAFDLIAFTERYDKRRRVRRVMARSILRRIYSLRRSALTEEFPVFTLINPRAGGKAAAAKRGRGPAKKAVRKRLEGLCFCGSGKPFRECHGKPKTRKT